jgi:excisionase family DNA binding protein
MFLTVHQTADALGVKDHQVYYLLAMGYLEAVKVEKLWRVVSDAVRKYQAAKKKRAGLREKILPMKREAV